jgi:hypothetical protein
MLFPPHNSPHKGLRLKTPKPKSCSPPAVGNLPIMKTRSTATGPVSTAKAATIPARPVARKPVQPGFLNKTLRNVTPMFHRSIAHKQANSPKDRSKTCTSKIAADIPAPKLKLQRHKRISIIPKTGKSSLFSPEQSPGQIPFEIFSDEDYESSPTPRSHRVETPSGDIYLCEKRTEYKLDGKMRAEVRPSLSLPNRRMKTETNKRVTYKTVRWDPAIVVIGPPAQLTPEKPIPVIETQLVNKIDTTPINSKGLDPGECLNSIKVWSKSDRETMENLLRALRELDSKSEAANPENEFKTPSPKEQITITTVRSLDPRVPDFQPLQSPKEIAWLLKRPPPHRIAPEKEEEVILDENVPPQPRTGVASPRKNTGRKPTICDDHRAFGREVDSFEQWYADKQLMEFMKRYPMTGKKVSPKKKLPARRRSDVMASSGPTAGRNAAVIQQRLEFLLWKNKEKKAIEKLFSDGCAGVGGSV